MNLLFAALTAAVMVTGLLLTWQWGSRKKSLAGAFVMGMLTLITCAALTNDAAERAGIVMLWFGLLAGAASAVLLGWLLNVLNLMQWVRIKRDPGLLEERWLPWFAWYPVQTLHGTAWLRRVEMRHTRGEEGALRVELRRFGG